jgi:hypothetical protein
MLRLRAIAERQTLVEELYDDLEALLLGRHGNAEEEDLSEIITFQSTAQEQKQEEANELQQTAASGDQAWKQSLLALLAELEKTRVSLHGGLTRLERLIEKNSL